MRPRTSAPICGGSRAIRTESRQGPARRRSRSQFVGGAQLGYSRITSPIDGVVTDLPLYPGEMTRAAPVVTVMDVTQVIARTHITSADAAELKVGNDANLTVSAARRSPAR